MAQFVIDNIDTAIEKEYIKVFYQPIIRVSSEKICGYEALARWEDPVEGMLSPGSFIPPLEEYHMIHKVDLFVISKVCEDLSRMLDNNEKVVANTFKTGASLICHLYFTIVSLISFYLLLTP